MFSRLLLCHSTGVNSSLSQKLLPRYVSQTILSLKPKLTRALHLTRDAPFYSVSKLRVSNLRRNGAAILTKVKTNTFVSIRQKETVTLNIDTNILNNVYLYKYDRPKYFKYLNGFAVFQLFFWLGLSYVMSLQLPARDPKQTLKKYVFDNFPMAVASAAGVIVGIIAVLLIWTFTTKSVRYIILHKGGKDATFVMYHPLYKDFSTTVSIDTLKCKTSRNQMRNYLPIKLQGRSFYYILDSSGEFVNPLLFDYTVGALRR